ncbi:ATP-binding protein [Oceanospirillum sediminis]|uniref:histidine kinase n=1 Tax=Oceanospirillum sediminis TaxID=2760088 RepID=A0A839IRM9_9GAMM|nr:ATP-binding protein [Oceanospirillum sediminis]MBB1487608.1 HAMP domain-containing protein [Oceanospirillum sediminis]
MARIFISLYAGLIAAILLFWVTMVYLYGEREQIESRRILQGYTALSGMIYEMEGEQAWLEALNTAARINLMKIEPVNVDDFLSDEEKQQLHKQGSLARSQQGTPYDEFFIAETTPGAVVRVRYDDSSDYWQESEVAIFFVRFGLFIIIAIALALWLWRFHRKLMKLQLVAQQLAEGNLSARAPEGFFQDVGHLNKAFNHMAERLEVLISSHKRLTNAVAHELRTPVFRLRCQLELLFPNMSEEEIDAFVVSMDEDLEELDTLVDELLSYARMESGRQSVSLQSTELNSWLRQQTDFFARACPKQILFPAENAVAICINLDVDLVRRALSNLTGNAATYAQTTVEVSCYRSGRHVIIAVDDDGPGIPESDRERVLEPFERLDRSRNRSSGGYGLGLSICREIALLHKGRLEISDSDLGGARIMLVLPADLQEDV